MFEHKSEPLVPRWAFYARMAQSAAIVAGIIACSLFVGSAGYHYLGDLPWIDSLLNASMILAGMGPVDPLKTDSAKLFADLLCFVQWGRFPGDHGHPHGTAASPIAARVPHGNQRG